ncbi:MAG: hypothetical protein ABI354_03185 [Candidatus Saccharimonadales bacterium]
MNIDIEQIVWEYIDKSLHMSLATSNNNKPWVCEVHFAYDENLNIYWRSQESRRHSQEVKGNPSVAGNIVRQHAATDYPHAIYFEGRAEIVSDDIELKKIASLFAVRLGIKSDMVTDSKQVDGHKFYKISVENWYAFGKFGGSSGYKYKLEWNGGKR